MAMPDNPVESQEVETAEGRRAVVRTTRTLLYLQERAERVGLYRNEQGGLLAW